MRHCKAVNGQYQHISTFGLISEDRGKPSQLWIGDKLVGHIEEDSLETFLKLFDTLIVAN